MNRLEIKYTIDPQTNVNVLKIYNDIKGLTCEQVGKTFYGKDADIMYEYFKNSVIKKNDKIMSYGIRVDKEK